MVKDFPSLSLEKILKQAGATRVSPTAVEELKFSLLEIAEKIARDAIEAAHHAGRITIKRKDIKLVAKRE